MIDQFPNEKRKKNSKLERRNLWNILCQDPIHKTIDNRSTVTGWESVNFLKSFSPHTPSFPFTNLSSTESSLSFPFFESTSHICFNAYTAARAPFSAFSRRFRCFPRPPRRCNHPHPPRRRLRPLLAASSPSPSRPRAFSAILSACFGTIPAITNGSSRWKLAFCLFVEINPSFLIRVKYYSQNWIFQKDKMSIEIKKSEKFRITFQRKLVIPSIRWFYVQLFPKKERSSAKEKKKKPPPSLISNISNVSLSTSINFPTLINVVH